MADIQRDARRFSRFDFLTNWGEQFDGYKSFILCRDPEELLVLYRTPDDVRGSASFTANGFVTATQGFLTWFESEGKRLMDKRRKPG